jgi:hypothetical protein
MQGLVLPSGLWFGVPCISPIAFCEAHLFSAAQLCAVHTFDMGNIMAAICVLPPRHLAIRGSAILFIVWCYLVQAWDVRNSCKHNGAVLPLPSAPEGRGADGVDAMA